MTPDEIRQAVCKATCPWCEAGMPTCTYPPNKTIRHAEDGESFDDSVECIANLYLAERVVKWVQEAREEGAAVFASHWVRK